MRYHPGARPGNRDGASDLRERGRLSERTAVRGYLLGRRRGQGTGAPRLAGHRPQRLPLLPFPAPLGLVSLRGDGGWGGTAEGREAGERSPWQSQAGREGIGRRALAGGQAGGRAEVEKGARRRSIAVDTLFLRMPASLGELCLTPEAVTDLRGGFLVFLPPTPSQNHSEKTHVVAADNSA